MIRTHTRESHQAAEGVSSLEHTFGFNVGKRYGYWNGELEFHEGMWDGYLKLIGMYIE